jgi:hypothetical protein
VDLLDHVGPREAERVVAALPARAAEVGGPQLARLDLGSHRPVEEEDVALKGIEEAGSHEKETSEE